MQRSLHTIMVLPSSQGVNVSNWWKAEVKPPTRRAMDKSGFALLFQEAVRRALERAGVSAGLSEPLVEFHGNPNPKRLVAVDEASDFLWLSPDRFYRVVDVAAFLGEDDPR